MFGWPKKDKTTEKAQDTKVLAKMEHAKDTKTEAAPAAKPSKEDLIRDAMANTRLAREAIGEETLARLSDMMRKQARRQQLEKIKADIIRKMESNPETMTDHLKFMLQDKKSEH